MGEYVGLIGGLVCIGYMLYWTHTEARHTESGPPLVLMLVILFIMVICGLARKITGW